MSSPLSVKQWIVIILANVLISAITTLMIVRVLTVQPGPMAVSAAAVASTRELTVEPTALPAAMTQSTPTASDESISAAGTPVSAPTEETQDSATATPAESPTPERQDEPGPAEPGQSTPSPATAEADVRISAVLYPGQRQREVVVIVNEGSQVEMKDWTLASSQNITYTFGNVTLFKDSFINLHTTTGADVPTDLFWNRTEPAWKSGDVLTLANGDQVIATYKVK
jgi:hypothetical protein